MPTSARAPGAPVPAPPAARRANGLASAATLLPVAIGLATIPATTHTPVTPPVTQGPSGTADVSTVKPAVCSQVQDSDDCHSRYPAGCDAKGDYDAALAFLKDLTNFSASIDGVLDQAAFLDKEKNLPKDLGKANHQTLLTQLAALGEGHIFQTVGYLYEIKQEKGESCNCELDTPDAIDYHMYIGYDPARAKQLATGPPAKLSDEAQSVIVEMTPQVRERFHPEWQFDTIKKFTGQQVRITGQLLADNEHYVHGQDCALGQTSTCFRATIWELHPVTAFEVCTSGDCTATTGTWSDVTSASASH